MSSDATLMHISIMARESSEFDNQDIYIYICVYQTNKPHPIDAAAVVYLRQVT